MQTRRKLLASIGTVTLGTGTASGLTQQDEQTNRTDEDPQGCLVNNCEDDKNSKRETGIGVLYLSSSAHERTLTGGASMRQAISGSVNVSWERNSVDANSITIWVTVTADGLEPKIKSAPNRFSINGNTASFSTSNSNSNRFGISYGTVEGTQLYCSPDLKHDVQAVVDYGSGQQQISHRLDPC